MRSVLREGGLRAISLSLRLTVAQAAPPGTASSVCLQQCASDSNWEAGSSCWDVVLACVVSCMTVTAVPAGVMVNGRHYVFLAYSSSQLKVRAGGRVPLSSCF
jgi:hypothetical protein